MAYSATVEIGQRPVEEPGPVFGVGRPGHLHRNDRKRQRQLGELSQGKALVEIEIDRQDELIEAEDFFDIAQMPEQLLQACGVLLPAAHDDAGGILIERDLLVGVDRERVLDKELFHTYTRSFS